MSKVKEKRDAKNKLSTIGYYGRPITDLDRDELLAAIAELVDMYNECKRKNDRCRELLGKEKLDSL